MSISTPTTAGEFRVKPNELQLSSKVEEWASLDYEEKLDMFMTDPDVTVFICIYNNYVMVVEGVSVTRDPVANYPATPSILVFLPPQPVTFATTL